MLIYRVRESKIVEHWLNADALSLLQQLGALPVPA
jgi:predicted ester cyclase